MGLGQYIGNVLGAIVRPAMDRIRASGVYQGYQAAFPSTDPTRLFMNDYRPLSTTADQALVWNLSILLPQCRQILRASPSARGLVWGFKSDIVGTGIAIEPDTGDPALDTAIKTYWSAWTDDCTADGRSLWEMQDQAAGEWFAAGAALWRWVFDPDRLQQGKLPLIAVPYEVEWLTVTPIAKEAPGTTFIRGIEKDRLGRPVAYHLANYEMISTMGLLAGSFNGPGERVLAAEITHGFRQDRPRQTHGEPMLAACLERASQEEDAVLTELKAAKASAVPAGFIKSMNHPNIVSQSGTNGLPPNQTLPMRPAAFVRLLPGDDVQTIVNNRPSEKLAPFRSMTRGDMAAATASSQVWLDRDSGRASYSSSRMDELLTERCRTPIQQTFARFHASDPYVRILPLILLQLGITLPTDPDLRRKMFRHKVLPDKMKFVDPVKDAMASRMAVVNGLSTIERECAAIGRDYAEIRVQRQEEDRQADLDKIARLAALNAAIAKAKQADPTLDITIADVLAMGAVDEDPASFVSAGGPPAPSASPAQPEEAPAVS